MKTPAHPEPRSSQKLDAYARMTKAELIEALEARDNAAATLRDVLIRDAEERQMHLELQNEQLSDTHADLELSRHRYADLYDLAPVSYLTFDDKGCLREINHTGTELLGYPAAHLVGKPFIPYLAQADRKRFLEHLWRCRREKKEEITTLRLVPRGGGERQIEFITHPARNFETMAGWCRSALVDVTERRAIEAALRESEAKFRILAENIGEVFWFKELNPTHTTYVSPAFEAIFRIPASELYADPDVWKNFIHPADRAVVHAAFHDWISGVAADYHIEYRALTRTGELRWLEDCGIIIRREDGQPREICGIASDITQRKQAEQALRLRNDELNAKNVELERFNRAMVDREMRMIELKQEINALLARAGQPPRHRVEFAGTEY